MRRLTTFLPCLLFLLFSGCLEFDAQEVTMRYDAKADRIDFLLVYRGVFYESGTSDESMDKAFADYDEVMAKGIAYFWNNWPLEIDLTKTTTPLAPLGAHVSIENGGLFTDPTGRLDGYQFARIHDASQFLEKLNTMLELAVQTAMLGGFRGVKFDRDTKEFVREFLREKEKMVRLEKGRIELRLPCSARDFKMLLGSLEDYFVHNSAAEMARRVAIAKLREDDPTATTAGGVEVLLGRQDLTEGMKKSPSFRFFWDNEITIERSEELQTIGIGARGNSELQVVKASEGLYSDDFMQAVRERGQPKIEDGVPDQELQRRFEDFLTREPVLAPELAAIRKK